MGEAERGGEYRRIVRGKGGEGGGGGEREEEGGEEQEYREMVRNREN